MRNILTLSSLLVILASAVAVHSQNIPYSLKAERIILEDRYPKTIDSSHKLTKVRAIWRRGCRGFPCMYTHLGSRAAEKSMRDHVVGIMRSCLSDPSCAPGRRKRVQELLEKKSANHAWSSVWRNNIQGPSV